MIRIFNWRPTLIGLLSIYLLAACGGEDPQDPDPQPQVACSQDHGTALKDGECVPIIKEGCADGRVLTPHGNCLDPDTYCGDNTVYDLATEECVGPEEITCGEGAIEVDGQCVVENPITCGEGTVLADGQCLLSEEVCGEGTEFEAPHCNLSDEACQDGAQWDVVNGECLHGGAPECGDQTVEVDDQCLPMVTYTDELAADADIDHSDGETIAPGPAGTFIFTGTMDDALEHTFDLQGSQGQWLKIEIYSRGLPAPGFELTGSSDWRRASVPGMASPASRTVYLPRSGNYELTVTSSMTDHPDGANMANEEWKYVGTAELVSTPTALQWNPMEGNLVGDLRESTINFIQVLTPDHDEVVLTSEFLGPDAEGPTLEVWSNPLTFDERKSLTEGRSFLVDTSVGETFLHIDAQAFYGPYAGFEISAQEPLTLLPGQFIEVEIFAEAGQLIAIEHINSGARAMDVTIFFQGSLVDDLGSVLASNQSSYSFTQHMRDWFYVPTTGTYTVRYENGGSNNIESFISQSHTTEGHIFDLPEPHEGPADFVAEFPGNISSGDWPLVVINTPSAAHIEWEQNSSSGFLYNRVYNEDREELKSTSNDSFSIVLPDAGTYYFYTRISSSAQDITIDVTGQSLETLSPGEMVEIEFTDVNTLDLLMGRISYDQGSAPDLRLINSNGQIAMEELEIPTKLRLLETFPGPGDFTLQVENNGDSPIVGFELEVRAHETYDAISPSNAFSVDYEMPPLAEGEKHFILLRPRGDTILSSTAVLDEGEEAALRVWDATRRELVRTEEGEGEVTIHTPALFEGTFVVEVEALTDIADDYDLSINGQDIILGGGTRVHTPPLYIEPVGPGNGLETSSIEVSGCDTVADISLSTVFDIDFSSIYIQIDLYAPGLSEPIRLNEAASGSPSLTTSYPDESEPVESLDPLIGTSGNGTWFLEIDNTASFTDRYLHEWTLELTCTE